MNLSFSLVLVMNKRKACFNTNYLMIFNQHFFCPACIDNGQHICNLEVELGHKNYQHNAGALRNESHTYIDQQARVRFERKEIVTIYIIW